MKRTKNMYYKETTESRELALYAENDSTLYYGLYGAIVANLEKKLEKGVYNHDRAVDALYRVATEASNRYNKDFGYSFDVQARFTVAEDMAKYFEEENEI